MLHNEIEKEKIEKFLSTSDVPYMIDNVDVQLPYTVEIDGISTTLTQIQGNFAKGYVSDEDASTECFIAKGSGLFAHGKTIKDAFKSLQNKINIQLPLQKRLETFKSKFPSFDIKVKAQELYDWHFYLTGSCSFGRKLFMKEHNIDNNDMVSVRDFLEMSKNSYGGEIIKMLI